MDLTQALLGMNERPIDNYYGMGANAIAQSMPMLVNPYASVGSNFATVAGAGLLSALLGSFAKQDALETNAQQSQVLGQFMQSDPLAQAQLVKENPKLSPLYSALSLQKLEDDRLRKIEEMKAEVAGNQKVREIEAQNLNKRDDLTATNLQKALSDGLPNFVAGDGTVKAVPVTGGVNPKLEESVDSLRKEFNGLPEVKAFSLVKTSADALNQALKDKGAVSDLELVRRSIQMIEPGMAVKEGEQKAVQASQSVPEEWKGALNKALKGETGMDDKVREGIKSLAMRAYDAQKSQYDKAYNFYSKQAEIKGIPKERLSYQGEAEPAAKVLDYNTANKVPDESVPAIPPGYKYIGRNPQTGKIQIAPIG